MNILRTVLVSLSAALLTATMVRAQSDSSEAPVALPDSAASAPAPLPAANTVSPAVTSPTAELRPTSRSADTVSQLETMVVTATRTQRKLSDIPVAVSVIDKATIDASPARNVDDLLLTEPGISVKRMVGVGEGLPADIIIRGVPGSYVANRVLILVDGIPTNVAGTPFLILNQVPIEAVERVEVVRGPFSSLYGSNAFSGVINIITRQAKDDPFTGALAGTFWPGTAYSIVGNASGDSRRIVWAASAGARGTGNYLNSDSILIREGDSVYHEPTVNSDYRDQRFLGRLGVWLTDRTNVTLHGRFFNSELGFGRSQDGLRADIINTGSTYLGGATVTTSIPGRLDLKLGGYARRLNGEFYGTKYWQAIDDMVASYWDSYTLDGQVYGQASAKLGAHNTLTAGADYLYSSVHFGETVARRGGQTLMEGGYDDQSNLGVYVQDEFTAWDRLLVVPGLRLDRNSIAEFVLSPKLATSFKIADWVRTRASVGRAFRSPSYVERSLPPQTLTSGVVLLSNPSLKPEYIWSVDGGLEFSALNGRIRPTLNGFYNGMQDLISPAVRPNPGALDGTYANVVLRNISEAWSAGFEAFVDINLPRYLTWNLVYTFTESRDQTFYDALGGGSEQTLDYVPRHMGSIGLQARIPVGTRISLDVSVTEAFVGTRSYMEWNTTDPFSLRPFDDELWLPSQISLDAYARTDIALRAAYRTNLWLGFTVTNLLNAEYEESGGIRAPGRALEIKLGAAL